MRTHEPACEINIIHEEVVARVRSTMPSEQSIYDLTNLYKMLADNTRLKILWALSREEMCVCDLAALLRKTKSAVSHQLKSLRLAKLIKFIKHGKNVYYSLADCHVREMLENGFAHSNE